MTSKERVKRAILFQGPDRIPYNLPARWGTDIIEVGPGYDPEWKASCEGEDEWGCIWGRVSGDLTMGQVVGHPLDDYAKLKSYRFPDYSIDVRYDGIREVVRNNTEQKFILAGLPIALNHRVEYLRGAENAWTDPYLYPDELHELLDRITAIGETAIEKFAEIGGVDGIMMWDDWGLQDRLMISPAIFREFFKPYYARLYKKAHEHGMLALLHSCGYIEDILDDFIEIGLNVIQMDQQENMGVEHLAERFGGRICFWCPVDIQKTMINGTLDDIRRYAKRLIDCFGAFNGGFIAQWYASPHAVNHSEERIDAMSQAFIEYGGDFYHEKSTRES